MFECPSSRRAYSIPFSRQIFVPHSWRARDRARSLGTPAWLRRRGKFPFSISAGPSPARWEEKNGASGPVADGMVEQLAQLAADRDATDAARESGGWKVVRRRPVWLGQISVSGPRIPTGH